MQTNIAEPFRDTPLGREADEILRTCVHCGFCTATCPTYQLIGDELDSPRGRIYLIKQLLEGHEVTAKTQTHLDRCLTCRSCETTCPSGVRYGRLADIGRELVERQVSRGPVESTKRFLLRKFMAHPRRFAPFLRAGQWLKPLLPSALGKKMPERQARTPWPDERQARSMLVLGGCVQSVATPETNAAAARVLNHLGIELIDAPRAGCCGALSYHLSAVDEGLNFMRRNIDAWWPFIEKGAEAIVITASGCGAVVKEYGDLLRHDPAYADKAERIAGLAKDISEILRDEDLTHQKFKPASRRVAFHSPCSLQHGQQLSGVVESILVRAGFTLTRIADAHLCCGSAGTYSILQPELSQQLLANKLDALEQDAPEVIATANIGCQMHISSGTNRPVKHWIQLLDEAIG